MSYFNLTYSFEKPAENYIEENWVHSNDTNFFKKQVGARVGHLALTPWSAVTSVADTIVGFGAGLAAIATQGKHKPTFKFAIEHLDSSKKIIVRPYVNLLKTLNPEAKFSGSISNAPYVHRYMAYVTGQKDAFITGDGDGFITSYVSEFLKDVARSCYNSDSFLKRHIASRLTYALLAVSSVITRLADGIIGVVAATLSFITLGKEESINNLAYRALQAPGIVNDIFYCTIKLINPWAGTSRA